MIERAVPPHVQDLATQLGKTRSGLKGEITVRMSGKNPGNFVLKPGKTKGEVDVGETVDNSKPPLLEVIGDSEVLQGVLNGTVDAEKQFLKGGIRIRGDLAYLSDLAQELGLLKHPL